MNIEFLNLLKSPWEGDYGRKEKNRRDEPIQVIIHIYMYTCHKENPFLLGPVLSTVAAFVVEWLYPFLHLVVFD
jgi:hypothetical protein